MKVVILAHGGHVAMILMPLAAVVYLAIALKGDTPKRRNAGTPNLPTHPLSRQIHAAITPPRAKKAASAPVPPRFMPSRAARKRGPHIVTPLYSGPPPKTGPDSSSTSAQNP
jgi:hypothetical protein